MFGAAPGRETIFIFCIKFVIGCAFSLFVFLFCFFCSRNGGDHFKSQRRTGTVLFKDQQLLKGVFL